MEYRSTPDWHGSAMQDTRTSSSTGFRRRCAAWRVTLERPKVTKGLHPRLFALLPSGALGSPLCPTARADGPSLAQRRSLGVQPRGLDKRAHLGEQQGATPNPQRRGRLTSVGGNKRSALHRSNSPCLFGARIGRGVISEPTPRPPHGEIRLSPPCNRCHRHGCIGEKIIVYITANGKYPYRETVLY